MNARRLFSVGVLLVALLALLVVFSPSPVMAQTNAPGVWGSSINIQNTGTNPATITIQFYKPDGTQPTPSSYTPAPLAAGGSLSIYVPGVLTSLPPGQYSAVVSSDQPLLVSVNASTTSSKSEPWTSFSYDGFDSSQTGKTLYFPGNYNNYYGFHSELVIQNVSNTAATVTATFQKSDGSVITTKTLGTVQPNAAGTFAMSSASLGLPSGNANGLFGAVVTSNENADLVGIVNIWTTSATTPGTASYSGFNSGSSTLYPPGLYNNYYTFNSALTIQNVHPSNNAVGTITYSNGTVVNFNLLPGAAQAYYQPANPALPSGNVAGIFSAKVTTTSGSIVGLVSTSSSSGGAFASYNVPPIASTTVRIPNINSDYYGFFTAVTVQNTGTVPTTIRLTYPNTTFREFPNVGPGQTVNFIHLDGAGDILPFRTSTSGVVTASQPLVAVIQHNTAPGVAGHDPSKIPSDFLFAVTGSP